ncbi:MAG TPA: FtsX-like permease family protein [Verrucomicrobiota bacterium]|nr:FtsX-like permease family protein [Verrucomicrobiota bacterium]HNU49284.1 FtsX-like permease family protein [Verrucomicrobiota bacterium]
MLPPLDRKLVRDLTRIKGQAVAVALVMACGLAMMIMARSLIFSLESTRIEYYERNRFAEVFVTLKRAPMRVADRVAALPGVARVQPGIAVQVTLDLDDLDEPASGLVCSIPESGEPELNRLHLRSGAGLVPGEPGAVLVGEAFADAHHLRPEDRITMLLNGRRRTLRVAGVVLSPEFIFESRPGAPLPDNRTYGTFWMSYAELAAAYNLDGAFNHLTLTLAPGAAEASVIAGLDRLLLPYGGRGAYGRKDHPSHVRVSDEIRVLNTLAIGFPVVFLSVAAFMTHSVLSRLLSLQREQIAILKAFGYTNRQIATHYLKFALVMVAGGTLAGTVGGLELGRQVVGVYHLFFRFPQLDFRLDRAALLLALGVSALAAVAGVFSAVRRAARLPPADAMRPEPPASYRPALLERSGIGHGLSHTFRIAVRNLERKPAQALLTVTGLALATGILIVPNCFRDGIAEVMGFQWDVVQRQDLSLTLSEPASGAVTHELRHLPGVLSVEPTRRVFVRLHHGHRHRQLAIQGLPGGGLHSRVINAAYRRVDLPPEGLVVSAKLAEGLGARPGDTLLVEVLEDRRPLRAVPLTGLAEDFAGIAAYMDLQALNRLLGEGDVVSGASFRVDAARRAAFLHALRSIPRVNAVAIKNSLRANFQKTTAASINMIQKIYLVFAILAAFGVVYNNARISLAERARELATLRVIGFSRREVAGVLVTELVLLALVAVPLGLWIGTGFATVVVHAVNTETVRLPLVLSLRNYALAVLIVTVASAVSAFAVLWKLNRLDLVGALKAPE